MLETPKPPLLRQGLAHSSSNLYLLQVVASAGKQSSKEHSMCALICFCLLYNLLHTSRCHEG